MRSITQTASTNSDVMTAARGGASEGYALIADQQVKGRGRLGRRWLSDPGDALLLSVLLRPEKTNLPVMPLLAGLAVQEALQRLVPHLEPSAFGLKWPNDIVMLNNERRKIAGILLESETNQVQTAVVVGIGLNLCLGKTFPSELRESATSLELVASRRVTRSRTLDAVLQSLERWLLVLEAQGAPTVLDRYRHRCETIGRNVAYLANNGAEVRGRVEGIDVSGAIIIATGVSERVLLSGDLDVSAAG